MFWMPCLVLLAYVVGSFPSGVVLSRRRFGIDVREMGSGNIGATNITRSFGWSAGVVTFLLDFLKGYIYLWFVSQLVPGETWLVAACGVALVFGHCFSLFLRFEGGKGVATTLGCFACVVPGAAFCMAATYVLVLFMTRISALGSLAGIMVACLWTFSFPPKLPDLALVLILSLLVAFRHHSNINRLLASAT